MKQDPPSIRERSAHRGMWRHPVRPPLAATVLPWFLQKILHGRVMISSRNTSHN